MFVKIINVLTVYLIFMTLCFDALLGLYIKKNINRCTVPTPAFHQHRNVSPYRPKKSQCSKNVPPPPLPILFPALGKQFSPSVEAPLLEEFLNISICLHSGPYEPSDRQMRNETENRWVIGHRRNPSAGGQLCSLSFVVYRWSVVPE